MSNENNAKKAAPVRKQMEVKPGTMPFYLIEGGRPNHKVYDKDISDRYKRLKKLEDQGTLEEMFKRCPPGEARATLGLSKQDMEDMVIAVADNEGNIYTEDPDVARIALNGLLQLNPKARLHPGCLPLPAAM